jgi:hypothetical protein
MAALCAALLLLTVAGLAHAGGSQAASVRHGAIALPAAGTGFTGELAVTQPSAVYPHPESFGGIEFSVGRRRTLVHLSVTVVGCDQGLQGEQLHLVRLTFRGPSTIAPDGSFRAQFATRIDSYPARVLVAGHFSGHERASGYVDFTEKLPARLRYLCGAGLGFIASAAPSLAGGGKDAWQSREVRAVTGTLVGSDPGPKSPLYPCTATVIDSDNQSVIVAAAHCLATFAGRPLQDFSFAPDHTGPVCPALDCGSNPLGVWTATAADAYYSRAFPRHASDDFGFLRLAPNRLGERLQLAVALGDARDPGTGGWVPSLAPARNLSPDLRERWWSIGYPVVSDGERPINKSTCLTASSKQYGHCEYAAHRVWCSGVPSAHRVGAAALALLGGCYHYRAGASGGPWFNHTGDVGLVNKAASTSALLGTPLGADASRYLARAGAGLP